MFVPTNPEQERIRALSVLSALTEYDKAVDVFARDSQDGQGCDPAAPSHFPAIANRSRGQSIVQVFQAIYAELLMMLRL